MKNIKKIFSIILLALLLISVTVNGAVNVTYRVETNSKGGLNQVVTLVGEDVSYAGKTITLRVWQKDKTESDIDGRLNDMEIFSLLDQTKADKDGKFEFSFIMNKSAGNYQCDIKVGNSSLIPVTLTLSDVKKINDIILLLNDEDKVDELTTSDLQVVLSDADKFGMDVSVYNRLSDNEGVTACIIKGAKDRLSGNQKIEFEDFLTIYNNAVVLEAFRISNDGGLLMDTIDIYDEFLGLPALENASEIYATYLALDDMGAVVSNMGKTEYPSIENMIEKFKEGVLTEAVKETEYYTDFKDIIDNNSDYLELGEAYTKYSVSDNLAKYVQKRLITFKKNINSLSNFRKYFEEAVKSYNPNPVGTGSSGGGGGGGSASANVSVSTELTKPEVDAPAVETPVFTDMTGHWSKDAVDTLVKKGILAGKEYGKFCPEDLVTREEFVTMIVKAFKLKGDGDAEFSDVLKDRWSNEYISTASNLGIVLGNDGIFNPSMNITRQDMAVIIYRTLQHLSYEPTRGNVDVQFDDYELISDYAKNSVTMLYYSNLISGDGKNFNPHSNAKRAEAAQMIYNVLKGE